MLFKQATTNEDLHCIDLCTIRLITCCIDSGVFMSISLKSRFLRGLACLPRFLDPSVTCARDKCTHSTFKHSNTNSRCSLKWTGTKQSTKPQVPTNNKLEYEKTSNHTCIHKKGRKQLRNEKRER